MTKAGSEGRRGAVEAAASPTPTRERILDAAGVLFAERGYAGTSVREIAEACGLRAASLYNHFEGKQALYEAVLERGLRPLLELLERAAAEELSTAGGEALVDAVVDHLARTPHVPRLIVQEGVSGGTHLARVARRWIRPLVAQGLATVKRSPFPGHRSEDEAPQLIAAWMHLVFGPFALAPLLAEVFDADPLSEQGLARQKAFLRHLARRLSEPPPPSPPAPQPGGAPMSLDGIDVYDPERYAARGIPFEDFARLRREAPVHFHPEPAETGGEGFWVLSRYEDVRWASKRPDLFSSWRGGTNIRTLTPDQLAQVRAIMLNMDPPEHRRFRGLVNKAFTPRQMQRLGPRVEAFSRRIVDDVCEAGRCEFVQDVAARLPMEVICEMVGVPEEDREGVCQLAGRLIGFDDPDCQTSVADGQAAAAEMFVYAGKVAALKRAEPADDLATALLEAEVDGEHLTELEFNSFFMLLAVAGNETTRTATCHAVRLLSERPELRERLAAEPGLLPSFIEEVLRYEPPIVHFRRTATEDVELRGERIREGDKVTLWYPSANRDEAVFPEPERFDPARSPNDHLAFGMGEHYCLGANLARLELRVLLGELLARLPDLELDGPVRRLRSNFVNGVKAMPVRFTPAPRSEPGRSARGTIAAR